jgi:hypothetical protein
VAIGAAELLDARTQARRIGVNLNQAARALNATGEPPIWLELAVAIANRAVTRLDQAARDLSAVARQDHPGGGRARTEPSAPAAGRRPAEAQVGCSTCPSGMPVAEPSRASGNGEAVGAWTSR